MPVNLNRAGYIRQTGASVESKRLPRVLLPLPIKNGEVDLTQARDPAQPTNAQAHLGGGDPGNFWIDIHVPVATKPGEYNGACEILEAGGSKSLATVPIKLTVHDFVLP